MNNRHNVLGVLIISTIISTIIASSFLIHAVDGNIIPSTNTLTLTFSGSYAKHFEVANLLNVRNIKATYYVSGRKIGNDGYMTVSNINELNLNGHEIGSGGLGYRYLNELNIDDLYDEVCVGRGFTFYYNWNSSSSYYRTNSQSSDLKIIKHISNECGFSQGQTSNTMCSEQINDEFDICSHNILFGIDGQIDELVNRIESIFDNSTNAWVIINFDNMCNSHGTCIPFLSILEDITNKNLNFVYARIKDVTKTTTHPLPEEYQWNPPDDQYIIGFYVGLGLMGGFLILIVVYMTVTACRRAQRNRRKSMALIDLQRSLQSETV